MNCKTFLDALAFIAKKFGRAKLHNHSHVIACLKDLLPERKAARKVMDTAYAMGIAEKFDQVCGKAAHKQQVVLSQCSIQLCSDLGFQKEIVDDVLWAYGIAMGFEARPEALPKSASSPAPTPSPQSVPQPLPQPVPSQQPPNSQAISTKDIEIQYHENIIASETQYVGKRLKFIGTVDSVKRDNDNQIFIALSS